MHRLRAILRSLVAPLALYVAAGGLAAYFVWHGVNGQRGLKIGEEYEQRLAKLREERDLLHGDRMLWERRIALFRGETVDADILDEAARVELGRVHKNELVIFLPPGEGQSK
jgi:cell division protein FtsB